MQVRFLHTHTLTEKSPNINPTMLPFLIPVSHHTINTSWAHQHTIRSTPAPQQHTISTPSAHHQPTINPPSTHHHPTISPKFYTMQLSEIAQITFTLINLLPFGAGIVTLFRHYPPSWLNLQAGYKVFSIVTFIYSEQFQADLSFQVEISK
jgi:hypothetical protein